MTLLTNDQMQALTIDDIRERLNTYAKKVYGDNVNTDDNSIVGMDNGVLSILTHDIIELLQASDWSNHLLSASGKDLDRFGQDDGISRKSSAPAIVNLQISGEPGTEIPEGSQFSTSENIIFNTTEKVKIGDNKNVNVLAVSDTEGSENNVPKNTINVEVDIVDGVTSVTNLDDAQGGADEEPDISYRTRLYNERIHPKNGSEDGIKSYLENEVAGVKQAKVISNRTMRTDKYDNPPKSTHIYVIGGKDIDVANGIFNIVPAPANTVGNIHQTITNISGNKREVYFDRANTVPVYVTVKVKADFNFDNDSGAKSIKKQVCNYISLLEMGDDVLFSKLYEYIWKVDGLKSIDVSLGLDVNNQELKDIHVNEFELATISNTDIRVMVYV